MRCPWLLAVLLVLLPGCSPPAAERPPGTVELLDVAVLRTVTESPRLEPPPDLGPNRLAAGWRPGGPGPDPALLPVGPRSDLEIANLSSRERTLRLALAPADPEGAFPAGRVVLRAGERVLADVALAPEVRLGLEPLEAPRTHVLSLRFESTDPPRLVRAALTPAEPAGAVEVVAGALVQEPGSLVELFHADPRGGRVRLRFEPTGAPGPHQRFSARLETATGENRVLAELAGDRARAPVELAAEVPPGAFGLALAAVGSGAAGRWSDLRFEPREAAAAEPADVPDPSPVDGAGRPRVVLVYVLDALRADAAADPEVAPTLARLAGEGLSFARHRSVAPNTLPSTAALFYGRLFERVLDPRDVLVEDAEPLAGIFRREGYATALFSSNVYVAPEFHMDRGFDHVAPRVDAPLVGENRASDEVADEVRRWLATREADDDLFLYVHVVNPHNPYVAPRPWSADPAAADRVAGTPALVEIRDGVRQPTAEEIEAIRSAYRDSVRYADAVLGRLLDELVARVGSSGLAVAVTSDHGEELLERPGAVLHGHSLYEEAVRIPLVLWPAERFGRGTVEARTSTLDLHRILATLARGSRTEPADPHRVIPLAASGVPHGIFALTDGRWKIVLTGAAGKDGSWGSWGMGQGTARSWDTEYWFDLASEEGEDRNRIGSPAVAARHLRELAVARRGTAGDVTGSEEPSEPLSPETREQLKALGYL